MTPAPPAPTSSSRWTACVTEYILAMRPHTFTAAVVPILLTAAVTGQSFKSPAFLRALAMGVSVQAAANLSNTYYDFRNGVDNKDTALAGGDKALVEAKLVTCHGVLALSLVFYFLGALAVYPALMSHAAGARLSLIFVAGVGLAFFYTAGPMGYALKYIALGDITIYLCFGPLLMQGTSIMMTGETNNWLYLYSVPVGLLTEAILHVRCSQPLSAYLLLLFRRADLSNAPAPIQANNARDIKTDIKAGATTLASLIGLTNSFRLYAGLLAGSYLAVAAIALHLNWGVLSTLLVAPLAVGLVRAFAAGKLKDLDEETAKFHLPFGVLLVLGVLLTDRGLLQALTSK